MRVLPVRRLASSALCAALLVGVTGPAAMAADPARERGHAASSDAPPPSADALRAQVGKLDAAGGALAPVADLLNAALKTDGGRLSAAEAKKLGDAAKRALADSAKGAKGAKKGKGAEKGKDAREGKKTREAKKAEVPASSAAPKASRTAPDRRAADTTGDTLDAAQKDIDSLVESIAADDVDQVLAYVDHLLADVLDFVTATLADSGLSEAAASVGPTPADTSTSTPEAGPSADTLPPIDLPAPVPPPKA